MPSDLFIRGLCIDWAKIAQDSYLREIAALQNLECLEFRQSVTFFVGENGSGKSTLLEALAVAWGFNPEGGSRNYNFATYNSHSTLCEALRLTKGVQRAGWGYFLRAESFYNVATKELEYADAVHPSARYHEKSHGESFLAVVQQQFKPRGLYILDEPEAALSVQGQLTLLMEINRCVEEGSQFFIVTHSPLLLGLPGAAIFSFDEGTLHQCAYEDTDSYQITAMFINNREQLLRRLL